MPVKKIKRKCRKLTKTEREIYALAKATGLPTTIAAIATVRERHPAKPEKDICEVVQCPVCMKGELHFTVSSYNGHVAGRCTTKGCIAFRS